MPTNGKSVTIETADGYSVTLTHLGSIVVAKGATVAERDLVGTVGPSGTPEVDGPYVHLGIRLTSDEDGYVDPLGLLPAPAQTGADESGSTVSQPASTVTASAPPAKRAASAPKRPRAATSGRPSADFGRSVVRTHEHQPAEEPRSEARTTRSTHRRVRARGEAQPRVERDSATVRTSSFRRPLAEPAIPQARPSESVRPQRVPAGPFLALLCNWAAALFALGAVLLARRRRPDAVSAEVLHLPLPEDELRRVTRAA